MLTLLNVVFEEAGFSLELIVLHALLLDFLSELVNHKLDSIDALFTICFELSSLSV